MRPRGPCRSLSHSRALYAHPTRTSCTLFLRAHAVVNEFTRIRHAAAERMKFDPGGSRTHGSATCHHALHVCACRSQGASYLNAHERRVLTRTRQRHHQLRRFVFKQHAPSPREGEAPPRFRAPQTPPRTLRMALLHTVKCFLVLGDETSTSHKERYDLNHLIN